METVVARFVARLRRDGVRVSPGESVDAVHALGAAGLADRRRARAALQLTLVKNVKDLPAFDRAFDAFFAGEDRWGRRPDLEQVVDEAIVAVEKERTFALPNPDEGERSGATLLVDDPGDLDEVDLDSLTLADGDGPGAGRGITVHLPRPRRPSKGPRPVQNYTQGPIYQRQDLLERWKNDGVKPFSPEEEAAMEEVVARMLRRLRKDVRQMKSRQARGRLSVVKTLQRNYRHGLVPFVKVLRRKRKEKPRLVVLCDVSFSVSHASRFMLLLLHTLQKGLLDVRSFVFNRELAEVTSLLRTMPLNALLEVVDRGEIVDLEANSDYGHALTTFRDEHLDSVRGRPAVIVLGDARNNYNEPHDAVLAALRERAGFVLWLTPEDRTSWDLGDCLMHVYGPHCDRVEVVKNVEELSAVVEELVRSCYAADAGARGGGGRGGEVARPAPVKRLPWRHGGVTVR